MTLAIPPSRGIIIIVGVVVLALVGLWSVVRALDGIQQARLAYSAAQSLDLRLEAIENSFWCCCERQRPKIENSRWSKFDNYQQTGDLASG